jgi:hypothetical protein
MKSEKSLEKRREIRTLASFKDKLAIVEEIEPTTINTVKNLVHNAVILL